MDRVAEIVSAFVVNAAWQTTAIAGAALLLDSIFGNRAPRVRYRLLLCALACGAAMPLAVTVLPSRAFGAAGGADYATVSFLAMIPVASTLIGLTHLFARSRRAAAVVASSRPLRGPLRAAPLAVPITAGIVRPVVILPEHLLADRAVIRSVLRHEIAHVRRRDVLVALVIDVLMAPLSFHPAVHMLRRRLAEVREMCCDAAACSRDDMARYIRALFAVARSASGRRDGALAMASTTSIEKRIEALRIRTPRASYPLILLAALAAVVVALAGCRYGIRAPATLSGTWVLDRESSNLPEVEFRQVIRQRGNRVAVDQIRRDRRGVRKLSWRADGRWSGDRFVVQMKTPHHIETGTAYIHAGKLVCDATVQVRGVTRKYHAVFERASP